MSAAANLPLGERGEPAFDLIEPRGRGRGEVCVEARMAGKPVLDRRGLVRAVVVHHQMDLEPLWGGLVYGAQEREELLRPDAGGAPHR